MQTYEGMENYIFISYAHKDSDRVLPIVEALYDAGYRVWYDAGIEAGTEWPEYVAEHLYNSAVVLVFLSKNALNSQNCTREINFAISERKEILVVYMEELQLSLGMRMQLGTLQAMFYDRYSSLREFMQALSAAKILNGCQIKNAAPSYAAKSAYAAQARPQVSPAPLSQQASTEGFVFFKEETYRSPYSGEVYHCCAVTPQKDFEDKHVFIPERSDRGMPVGRIPVGRIQSEAFMSSDIESVHIPHSVRVIDELAFAECTHLTALSIENGVELIEQWAFLGCPALQRIILPRSLKKIGDSAFNGCEALELVELPDGLEYIGSWAFDNCKLHSIFIPKSVKTIEDFAFGFYPPETIYCEAEHLPMGWGNLFCGPLDKSQIVWGVSREQAKIYANSPVKAMSAVDYAFSQEETYLSPYTGEVYPCCAVAPRKYFREKHVFIPERSDSGVPVGRIRREAFMMSRIESVHIPHSVRVIDEFAFGFCDHLTALSIENGVELIEQWAFLGCPALQRIILPRSLKKIGDNAFNGCEALELVELPDGLEYIGSWAFRGCKLRSIFIPESVKTIEREAFMRCKNLETIYCETQSQPSEWSEEFYSFYPGVRIVWGAFREQANWGVSREQAKKMENN